MGSSSVTNYNNHFVGWVREQNKGGGRRGEEGARGTWRSRRRRSGRIHGRICQPASNRSDVVVNVFTGSLTSRRETTTFVLLPPYPCCFTFPETYDFSYFRSAAIRASDMAGNKVKCLYAAARVDPLLLIQPFRSSFLISELSSNLNCTRQSRIFTKMVSQKRNITLYLALYL